jgi:MFS family permease
MGAVRAAEAGASEHNLLALFGRTPAWRAFMCAVQDRAQEQCGRFGAPAKALFVPENRTLTLWPFASKVRRCFSTREAIRPKMEGSVAGEALLRYRPFARFLAARALSAAAIQMQAVAIGWYLYATTGRALDLGLLGLAEFIPVALLSLFAGHFADRHDRRKIAAAGQASMAGVAAMLALGTADQMLGAPAIFALVAAGGTARAFEHPTMAALMPGLVPPKLFSRASAWSASAIKTAQILGPALGGLLLIASPVVAFAVAAAMFLGAAALTWSIGKAEAGWVREPFTWQSLFSGIAFVRKRPVIFGTLSLDLFAVLLGGATALLPIFAQDILKTGPAGLGLLRAAPAVGALIMSVVLAHYPLKYRVGELMFAAVSVFGAATIVFGLSTNFFLSLAALTTLGAADVVSVVIRSSLVQLQTPDSMRGRVSALNSLFIGASNQLGDFESGAAAALFGAIPAVLLGGGGTILVALIWMALFPDLRRLQTLEG